MTARFLVDAGNSRIKWACHRHGRLEPGLPFASQAEGLAERLDAHWAGLPAPAAVHVSNVAGPEVARLLHAWIERHWRLSPVFARSRACCGPVVNGYAEPDRLGADRWLGLLGLYRDHPLPACLVDCGTAMTLDALAADGRHLGGLIAPGLRTMALALQRHASALNVPRPPGAADLALGRDTGAAMRQGCIMAGAGLIEKTLATLRASTGADFRLVMTGGDAATIAAHVAQPLQLDQHIVLRGLLTEAEALP